MNGGSIEVFAQVRDADIVFGVRDTGLGLRETTRSVDSGVGLTNIRERLLALYQGRASLSIESNQPSGVTATITLPQI